MTAHQLIVRLVPLAITFTSPLVGCLDLSGLCGNQQLAEVPSPDGRRRAVVFMRDCGATTGFSTQVSVLAAGVALPDSAGNVFTSEFRPDSTRGPVKGGPGGGPRVNVRWLASDTLDVRYDAHASVFTKKASVSGVGIRFVPDSMP